MHRKARWLCSPGPAVVSLFVVAAMTASGCDKSAPPIVDPPPPVGSEILVGAGDIAFCGSPGTVRTGELLDTIPGFVFTAGDNAYNSGSALDFAQCYDPTWGRHRDRTFPVVGNHDYVTPGASGYFDYFGSAAGERNKGYYRYNVGVWRVIALNSEQFPAAENGAGNAAAAAAQLQWFKTELATNNVPCTIAIWHRPLYSSGLNGPQPDMRDLYKAAYDGNVEIVINGHDHNYERFAPQDADGRRDDARGVREFVVGTGGIEPTRLVSRKPNSDTFQGDTVGVLKLTLRAGAYTWDYVPIPQRGAPDSGNGVCH